MKNRPILKYSMFYLVTLLTDDELKKNCFVIREYRREKKHKVTHTETL